MKKNILYINHISELGGGEYGLLNLIKAMDKDKYNLTLLLQNEGPLSNAVQKIGVRVRFIKMRGWRKIKNVPQNYLFTLPKIRKMVKELKIDLIHCNTYRLNPYSVLVAKSIGIPCITHIRWFTRKDHIKKFKLDKADLLIAMSDYMASFFKNSSCNVRTIYDGIDIDKFKRTEKIRRKIRKELNIDSDKFLVGMIAQITPRKGHKDFIKAAALVKDTLPKIRFVVVGGSIIDSTLSLQKLKDYAEEVGASNLIFLGQRDDVPDIFSALDCFVLPSHTEPFGLVVIEAMAAKVPVVATCSGGPEEIIIPGESGILIPIKDPNAIANAVTKMFYDKDFRNRSIENAYIRVRDKFDISKYAEIMDETYRKMF